jgi:integrase
MSRSLTQILQRYCLAMGIIGIPDAFLFPGKDRAGPISIRAVRNKFDVTLKNLGIKQPNRKRYERGPCQHCFRHIFVFESFAQAQKNGRSIDDSVPFLSIYLGHDSLRETEKYLKFSSELFPNALELFEGYSGMVFPEADHEKQA